ncbi:DUF4256 domain-containing protein [Mucilaginibacter terrae]|uniref:DUF4256 domain-containing protein n=1 Tax=Mucilaginibacter terrae TaxID=1955052 RepID=UPI0036300793
MKTVSKGLSADERTELFDILKSRFKNNTKRHKGVDWDRVQARLEANSEKLWSLKEMEITGGEPDVVGEDSQTGEIIFFDCSAESPKSRRSLCYDQEAMEARKENKPVNSALGMAYEMCIEVLTEEQYRHLQTLGKFDTKTSSWLQTPAAIRKLGGSIFADYRYGQVFVYHNGASSYYAVRGFRSCLKF